MNPGPLYRRRWFPGVLGGVAIGVGFLLGEASLAAALASGRPWWDEFPGIIQTADVPLAIDSQANANLCGAADDPCWGLFAQQTSVTAYGPRAASLHAAGLKCLTWFEGFGTCESYVAQLKRGPTGEWVRQSTNPPLTAIFNQHWSWQAFDGSGEIHWVGLPNYFDDEEFARPWTRVHPRYGAPPMRYPDGRLATGYAGPRDDPRNSRVLDAGCSKDILGRLTFDYDYNEAVNRLDPQSRQPHGPTNGLVRVENAPIGAPDPGFTPDEWKTIKKPGYAGVVSSGKDSACPVWIDYLRASVRRALDSGIDGLWVDNYSPWDSFSAWPVTKAFGDWSVAGFRTYLRTKLPSSMLAGVGITDTSSFDIRSYLCARCREWGGKPDDLNDPHWRDPRFLQDPVWRAYLIYKRQTGTQALSNYYRVIKEEARKAGKPDFLVMGNDIPVYSLGWVRSDLDMVSTELTWGWHLTSGPRGFMPPPAGNYAPVYKLAREHARSRFVNAWLYGPDDQLGRSNIARVLYYQALANHASPMPNPGGRTVGNAAVDKEFFSFLRRVAPVFSDRVPIEEVGLYYSSSSQLMEMTPGGFRDHNHQPHSFAFWGWSTAFTQLHLPWRAVPKWKLNRATLRPLRLLVIPDAQVFDPADLKTIQNWVQEGGTLIVTGTSGSRAGESSNFELARVNPFQTLAGDQSSPRAVGKGRVFRLPEDPGAAYYEADAKRPELLPRFQAILQQSGFDPATLCFSGTAVPTTIGMTPYRAGRRLFIDLNNTDLDSQTDTLRSTVPLQFVVTLPQALRGKKLSVQVLAPGLSPTAEMRSVGKDRVEVSVAPFSVYASVVVEAQQN